MCKHITNSRKYFYPITSDQACFKNKYKNEEVGCARQLAKKILVIPFYEKIEKENVDKIIDLIGIV